MIFIMTYVFCAIHSKKRYEPDSHLSKGRRDTYRQKEQDSVHNTAEYS